MQVSVNRFSMLNLHYAFELISLEKPKGGSLGGTNRKFSKVQILQLLNYNMCRFHIPPHLKTKTQTVLSAALASFVSPGEIHGILALRVLGKPPSSTSLRACINQPQAA